jgi:hypothetical protein
MILTHESRAQEDQFDEKNGGQKSRDTIPLKLLSYSRNIGRKDDMQGKALWEKGKASGSIQVL